MKILKQIQQGDVWIEKVDNFIGQQSTERNEYGWETPYIVENHEAYVEARLNNTARNEIILAAGEATGHHHRLSTMERNVAYFNKEEGDITTIIKQPIRVNMDEGIFELMEKAILTHEEHKPIELEPGLYRFGIINEYDYEAKQSRRVWD